MAYYPGPRKPSVTIPVDKVFSLAYGSMYLAYWFSAFNIGYREPTILLMPLKWSDVLNKTPGANYAPRRSEEGDANL